MSGNLIAVIGVSALVTALGPCAALASPWGQPDQGSLLITKADYYRSGQDDRRFEQALLEAYIEQGFFDRWSFGGKVSQAWQWVEFGDASDVRTGLAEAELFVQRQVFGTETQAAALQLGYGFATSSRSILFDEDIDGRDAAIELGGLWGVGNEIAFLSTQGAYRASLGDDADQIKLNATVGLHTDEQKMFLVDVYTTLAAGSAEPGGAEYDLVTLAPSLVFETSPHVRVQLGARADLMAAGLDRGFGGFISFWVER